MIKLSVLHLRSNLHKDYPRSLEVEHADLETPSHVGPMDHKDMDENLVPRTVADDAHVEV